MTDHDPYGDPTRVEATVADPTQAMPATVGGPPPGGPLPPIDGPPPGSGDRRWWILGGLFVLVLLIGLAVLLLADSGSDDEATGDTSTTSSTVEHTTTSSSTTTSSTTTSSTTTTASPSSTVAPGLCRSGEPDDPESSVEILYQAFTLRDRSCAREVATNEAVDELFAIPGKGGDWEYQGCTEEDLPDPHVACAYTFPGGATHFRTSYNDLDGWVIYEVFQTAD